MSISTFPTNVVSIEPGALPSPEAAKYLGVSTQTLANWRSLGKGPVFVRFGESRSGRVVYRVADLDKFLAEHIVSGERA